MTIREYVNRPFSTREQEQMLPAIHAVERIHKETGHDVEITIRKRGNPNAITVSKRHNENTKAERSLNLGWARKRGYADA